MGDDEMWGGSGTANIIAKSESFNLTSRYFYGEHIIAFYQKDKTVHVTKTFEVKEAFYQISSHFQPTSSQRKEIEYSGNFNITFSLSIKIKIIQPS